MKPKRRPSRDAVHWILAILVLVGFVGLLAWMLIGCSAQVAPKVSGNRASGYDRSINASDGGTIIISQQEQEAWGDAAKLSAVGAAAAWLARRSAKKGTAVEAMAAAVEEAGDRMVKTAIRERCLKRGVNGIVHRAAQKAKKKSTQGVT